MGRRSQIKFKRVGESQIQTLLTKKNQYSFCKNILMKDKKADIFNFLYY